MDKGLPHGLAYANDPISCFQKQPICQHPFAPRIVGMMPTVFGEEYRWAAIQSASRQRVKERRVLVGMHQVHPFVPQKAGQSPRTLPIKTDPALENVNGETLVAEFLAQRPELIQAGEYETVSAAKLSSQARSQYFGATHLEAVQHLANREMAFDNGYHGDHSRPRSTWRALRPHGLHSMRSAQNTLCPNEKMGRCYTL
jgi:hypothetical protein